MILKKVLLINALSSGITGAALVLASDLIAGVFATEQTQPFIGVGLFLLLFAAAVYLTGRQQAINPRAVRFVIAADAVWVFVSVAVVAFQVFAISTVGYLMISGVGIWVAAMAYLQARGLKDAEDPIKTAK